MTVVVVVMAVLAGGAYALKPLWQPWWYAATICGGSLSADDLADVLPHERLQAAEERMDPALDRMSCGVNVDDDQFSLSVSVTTDTWKADRELSRAFDTILEPDFPFPAGIPGFKVGMGHYIVQACPDLPRDVDGREKHLLTKVMGFWNGRQGTPAALRIAVSAANSASKSTGCGADPLPLPRHPQIHPHPVALDKTAGTPCSWLDKTRLPRSPSGKPWQAVLRTDTHTPVTSCSLHDPGFGEDYADFGGWYGTWSHTSFAKGPLMSEGFGRATARCDGEAANFHIRSSPSHGRTPMTGGDMRGLLIAFARDQAQRHGCTDLALPGKDIHPERSG
ncbi:hypothetical protein [Streptomyces sp. NPDC015125]|uniref:hypothetical protein n=1 Tax=Streptomyces sp. NPDC015125 TaxID=3364938 RepID=UPI0036FD06DF